MTTRTAQTRCLPLLIVVASSLVIGSPLAQSQQRCEEPTDDAFQTHMAELPEAVAAENFERVVEILEWPIANYDYAVLRYAQARAYQRLERLEEAEWAYTEFLRLYDGCPDPDNLEETAREYRSLVTAQIQAINNPPVTPAPVVIQDGFSPAWIPIGVGVAVLTIAIINEGANLHLEGDLEEAERNHDQEQYNEVLESWHDAQDLAKVAWFTGGAIVLGGVVWLVIDELTDDPAPETQVGWAPRPGGGVALFGGRF